MTRFITLTTLTTLAAVLAGCQDAAAPPVAPSLQTVLAAPGTGTQGQIVYASYRSNTSYDLHVLDPATGRSRRLTRDQGTDENPAWSPDGQKVAFTSSRGAGRQIYVMDATGDNVTAVTNDPAAQASGPTWSPDGEVLLFTSYAPSDFDISMASADGTTPAACVVCGATFDFDPAWAPASSSPMRFAFTSRRDNPVGDVYIYDASADPVISRLTVGGGAQAAWSPDGTKIAFASRRDGDWDIYVVSADGTGSPTKLTNNSVGDERPAWSPDGSRIVFQSYRDGNPELYVMNAADGSGVTRLTRNQTSDVTPNWKP